MIDNTDNRTNVPVSSLPAPRERIITNNTPQVASKPIVTSAPPPSSRAIMQPVPKPVAAPEPPVAVRPPPVASRNPPPPPARNFSPQSSPRSSVTNVNSTSGESIGFVNQQKTILDGRWTFQTDIPPPRQYPSGEPASGHKSKVPPPIPAARISVNKRAPPPPPTRVS